jgi:hypothetical protein
MGFPSLCAHYIRAMLAQLPVGEGFEACIMGKFLAC